MKNLLTTVLAITFVIAATAQAATYQTGYEDINKTGYAVADWSCSNIVWTFDSTLSGTIVGSDRMEGGRSIRFARKATVPTTEASMTTQVLTGEFSLLSFKYAKYGTGAGDATLEHAVDISSDYRNSWQQLGTNFYSASTAFSLFQETFGPYNDVAIRIRTLAGGTGSRVRSNVDTFTLTVIPEPSAILALASALALLGCGVRRIC